ncbi:hypothetical protein HOG21_05975 [bacterium]|jgi:hypothetical protein|nr:hypothetical protein [bacterium]
MVKNRDTTAGWITYTNIIDGSFDFLQLHLTEAKINSSLNNINNTIFNV